MCQDSVNHQIQGALLLEDDASQVEQNLVPLDLQQGPLVDLSVSQTKATKLKIFLKHLAEKE